MKHDLKIMLDRYIDILNDLKSFEIRKFDRDFVIGDFLILTPYLDGNLMSEYTPLIVKIIYLDFYEQKDSYVVLGIQKIND